MKLSMKFAYVDACWNDSLKYRQTYTPTLCEEIIVLLTFYKLYITQFNLKGSKDQSQQYKSKETKRRSCNCQLWIIYLMVSYVQS